MSRGASTNCVHDAGREQVFLAGVILFEETLDQKGDDGTLMPDVLAHRGIVPGIKVDKDGRMRRRRRSHHAGLGRPRRPSDGVQVQGRALRKVARGVQHHRPQPTPLGIEADAEVLGDATRGSAEEYRIVDRRASADRRPTASSRRRGCRRRAARRVPLHRNKVLLEGMVLSEHGPARQGESAEGRAGGRRARYARGAQAHGAQAAPTINFLSGRPASGRGDCELERDEPDGAARAVGSCRSPTQAARRCR